MSIEPNDVIECYKRILGREPENDAVTRHYAATATSVHNLVDVLLSSHEYDHRISSLSLRKCERNYLAKSFDRQKRVRAFCFHHDFLVRHVSDLHIGDLSRGDRIAMPSLRQSLPADLYLINSRNSFQEGELSLLLEYEQRRLYSLSFSLIPHSIIDSGGDDAATIIIACMQGSKDSLEMMKSFCSHCHAMHPQTILLAALTGIAAFHNVRRIVGVDAANHILSSPENAEHFNIVYDSFFTAQGFASLLPGFFVAHLPFVEKDLSNATASKRRRAVKRRMMKTAIAQGISHDWGALVTPAADAPNAMAMAISEPTGKAEAA